ncbi:stage II sporulation protein P [Heliophilum fasciatum]|uniref:Stage II sporulation protein P n=1 Tax=Heliophilum fasciatum TaxID=35700 RepID=A0A4R2RM19_9FIRM|nr:stage II sporulation protein P [Heliophilum fasciatum]
MRWIGWGSAGALMVGVVWLGGLWTFQGGLRQMIAAPLTWLHVAVPAVGSREAAAGLIPPEGTAGALSPHPISALLSWQLPFWRSAESAGGEKQQDDLEVGRKAGLQAGTEAGTQAKLGLQPPEPTVPPLTGALALRKVDTGEPEAAEVEGEDNLDVDVLREDLRGLPGDGKGSANGGGAAGGAGEAGEAEPIKERPISPVLLLYHTHNSETYAATGGKSRLDGQNAGVYKVGKRFAEQIKAKRALPVIHSERINDFPSYQAAYAESARTLAEMLISHPNPLAIMDIHRDAGPGRETVKIGKRTYAKILFVVGTDARAPHPRWRENLAFAEALSAKLNELYPGISKGILTKNGRYHQQVSPRALLVEIGSDRNATTEALASADALADALGKLLEEQGLLKDL